MTVPSIHHWLAGDDFDAERMNEIGDSITWLRNPPMVHVGRRNATQAITANTWTKISFDKVFNTYDPYGFYDSGTPDQLTITEPGWYTCECQVSFLGTSTDTRVIMGLYKNGFTATELLLRYDMPTLPNTGNINMRKETTLFFNVGDWMHLGVQCDGAAVTSAITSDAESTGLRIRWVSS